jgi:diaminopimelate decarboxylase
VNKLELTQYLIQHQFFSKTKKPFYIYQHDKLCDSFNKMKGLSKRAQDLFFSVKANPNHRVLKELSLLGSCFDVSSLNELDLVCSLGIPEEKMSFSGPAKTNETIRRLKKSQLRSIHLDSIEEFYLLKDSGLNLSIRIPLEDSFSQKLGIPFQDIERILSSKPNKLTGLHVYLGRERAQIDLVQKNLSIMLQLFSKYRTSFVDKPQLFWGGGFPATPFLKEEMFPQTKEFEVNIESGRGLCHEMGLFGTQVLSVKKRSPFHVVINGGLQYMASRYSSPQHGQEGLQNSFFNSLNQEILVEENCPAHLFGSLGIWNDILVEDIQIPKSLKRGDWILTSPAGSYGITAGVNQFISPDPLAEFYFKENKLFELPSLIKTSYLESGLDESRKA